jgi:hypothetical protein
VPVHRHHGADGRKCLSILAVLRRVLLVLVAAWIDSLLELVGLERPLHRGRPHREVVTVVPRLRRRHQRGRGRLGILSRLLRHDLSLLGDPPRGSDTNCWLSPNTSSTVRRIRRQDSGETRHRTYTKYTSAAMHAVQLATSAVVCRLDSAS